MARIGLTGATGYIGTALAAKLAASGHTVIGLDNQSGPVRTPVTRAGIHPGDIRDESTWKPLADADVLLHLAASSGVMVCAEDPVGTATVNVDATDRLARWSAGRGIPFAFASSFAVVGIPEALPITETTPARPTHEYAWQKARGEAVVVGAFAHASVPAAVVRMSNVYGRYRVDGQVVAKGNVLNLFAQQAAAGGLRVSAPGTQRRDFVHLLDVLDHWEAVARWLGRRATTGCPTFNVASGESSTVLDLAGRFARAWGAAHPDRPPPSVDIVPNPRGAVELLQSEFAIDRRWTGSTLEIPIRHGLDDGVRAIVRDADLFTISGVGPAH